MKAIILILCATVLVLASCREKEEDPAIFVTTDYDSVWIKSYDSIVYVNVPYVDPYYRYYPEENFVTYSLDIDKDNTNDYTLTVSHYLYTSSPHFSYNATHVGINSIDTSNFKIAVQVERPWAAAKGFVPGDVIDNTSFFQDFSYINANAPFAEGDFIYGNVYIGFRKGSSPSAYRYGYLNLIVNGANAILVKSVLNTNKDRCVVGVSK